VDELTQARVLAYERGIREPSLLVLLAYARLIGVSTDVLIDEQAWPFRLVGTLSERNPFYYVVDAPLAADTKLNNE
jgi:transcriptional regulator with XRE-family HTH domain